MMISGFINAALTSLGVLKDGTAPAATHAAATSAAAAATASTEGQVLRRAWRMDKAGRISDLKLVEEPFPAPAPGYVRVAVKAIGLNMADIFAIIGLYSATPQGSFVPGLEYAGIIDAVGGASASDGEGGGIVCSDGTVLKPGDKVFGFTRFGAYTSHVNVPSAYVRPLPEGWTMEQGASFVVQGLTAWHALAELGNCRQGQTVLVHSAAGGVGALALELCEKKGCFPIATIGSEAKVGFLQQRFGLKREQIIVRETGARAFGEQLAKALADCGRGEEGYDIILDALGGMYFKEGYKKLSRGGRMITFGAADYLSSTDKANWLKIVPRYLTRPVIDPGDLCSENRGVLGFNLIWLTDKVKELNAELDDMLKYPWKPPHVGSTYPMAQLPDAVRALQSGQTIGKVVVRVDE